MKKLALSSLIAVFAVSGAHAANVIDGNPLYMPKANHFYSVTELGSHSEKSVYGLSEEFGYGITDKLAVSLSTMLLEDNVFDQFAWDNMALGVTFRALDMGPWKVDALAAYKVGNVYLHNKDLRPADDNFWFDKDLTEYTWTAGVRGGYTTSKFTVAAKALFNYENTNSFNWNGDEGHQGLHTLTLGVDGQYVLCDKLNLVGSVAYTGVLDKEYRGTPGAKYENEGKWDAELGVNYNIDATKFVGLYVNGTVDHWKGDADEARTDKGWGFQDGFGFGAKFGIDF